MVGKKKKSVQILVFIVLIIGAIWAGFPVLWMFSNSFKGNAEIFTWPPTWISKNFSLSAYGKILTNPEQLRFFLNSYVIAALVVIVTLNHRNHGFLCIQPFQFPWKKINQHCYCSDSGSTANHTADPVPEPDRNTEIIQYILGIGTYLYGIYTSVLYSDGNRIYEHFAKGSG